MLAPEYIGPRTDIANPTCNSEELANYSGKSLIIINLTEITI